MNVYIAFTPYHLMLTLMMNCRDSSDAVLLIDESGNLSAYKETFPKYAENFFYFNCFFNKSWRKAFCFNWVFSSGFKSYLNKVLDFIKTSGVGEIFVFNDNSPISQFIVRSLGGKATYIEDGAAPYNDHYIENSIKKKILYRLIFGPFYEFTNVLGTSKYIDKTILTFPDKVRWENSRENISQYNFRKDRLPFVKRAFFLDKRDANFFDNEDFGIYILILLPRNYHLTCSLHDSYKKIIDDSLSTGRKVVVKKHPLDFLATTENLFTEGVFICPPFIPSEAIFITSCKLELIYGPSNTSMLSARFFSPHVKVRFISNKELFDLSNFEKLLIDLGAECEK